jgi:hypothetical protein
MGTEWGAVIHPAEIAGMMDKWNAAVATGQVYENVERASSTGPRRTCRDV